MISPKLIILLVILAAFALLGGTANHYHNKYIEAQQQIAVKQVELDGALASVKECSERTKALAEETKAKIDAVAQAQTQAAAAARNNYVASNKILEAVQASPDQCVAAAQLIEDYKRGLYGAKK